MLPTVTGDNRAYTGLAGPGGLQSHHTCALAILAPGLTLHLSSCDNVTGRDAGHVDQVDRAVSLNKETRREGEHIKPTHLPRTSTAPATPVLAPASPPVSLSPTLGGRVFHRERGAGGQSTDRVKQGGGRQHPAAEPSANVRAGSRPKSR